MWMLLLAISLPKALAAGAYVCPQLSIVGAEKLSLTESEKRLLCGDKEARDWQKVPPSQALFHLRGFLQDRGYYAPVVSRDGRETQVDIGLPTRVSEVAVTGGPLEISSWNRTSFTGELLTPALLSLVNASLTRRLGISGYACPKIETLADPVSGIVSLRVRAGKKLPLVRVEEEEVPGLALGTLRRYDAFTLGDPINADLLPLAAARAVGDGVVRNTYFNLRCTEDGVVAEQKTLPGKPREVTLGVGLNTDRGLVARGSWKHARLGYRGSQFATFLTASYKGRDFNTQEGRAELAWYFLDAPSRFHLRSTLTFRHQSDNRLDIFTGFAQMAPAATWDSYTLGGFLSLGPALNGERKFRGEGREQSYFLALAGDIRVTSHDFEWQRSDPRSGFEISSSFGLSKKGFLADFSSQLLRLRYTHLLPLPDQGRRPLILGLRVGFATTVAAVDEGGLTTLIPSLRHYLGGSGNLRGYSFQELPDANGGLTSFYTGVEARSVGVLPWGLQPYVLLDGGTVSRGSLDLTAPWYLSPGVGFRWMSPVGTFRTSFAHGLALASPSPVSDHWQLHFTFGEEF